MKSALPKKRAEKARSAVLPLPSGALALPRPSCAKFRLPLTESQAVKIGMLAEWQDAKLASERRQARKKGALEELQNLVANLTAHGQAQSPRWSQHTMQKHTGIPRRTFRRLQSPIANPSIYLPRLRAAAQRIAQAAPSGIDPTAGESGAKRK